MYKKILAPLDGSELAECALEHVKAIAAGCDIPEVILLRIVESISSFALGELAAANAELATQVQQYNEKEHTDQAKRYIDEKLDELKKEGIVAQPAIASGTPAEGILGYAEKNQIDLIVMSTHGRSGISRWAFGSVAEKVVRASTIPVLLVTAPGCRITLQ